MKTGFKASREIKAYKARANPKRKRKRKRKRKSQRQGDGETSEMRADVEISDQSMEILEMWNMMEKMKARDGETSEKRIDVEMQKMKTNEGDGEKSEKRIHAEMEISGQLVPTNNSMERKRKRKRKRKKKKTKILIEQGKHIDVKGFLSSKERDYLVSPKDGKIVPVSSLVGNHVLICCFSIPFELDTSEGGLCQSIQVLYSHLSDIGISDSVKLVIVLKLKQDASASAFDSFLSWFPHPFLTIPFWDSHSRHYVCAALSLSPPSSCYRCLALHPSGLILFSGIDILQDYGARAFPFTEMHFDDINRKDDLIEDAICSNNNHVILDQLLLGISVSQIADVNNTKSVPLSALTDAPVGLYLYVNGSFMNDLRLLHKTCLDKGLKFHVVVLPFPFDKHYDPVSFYDRMKQSALEDEISSSWWLFPFHDDISRTLWRIFSASEDGLVILPHGDICGDLYARSVVSAYGVDGYPFSKDAVIKHKVNHLRSLPLDRLLGKDFTDRWVLHNKNVLLYFHRCWSSKRYKRLKDGYCKIKKRYPDCEVVLVPFKPHFSYADAEIEIEWPILPAEKCEAVIEHIFPGGPCESLCAFGKDGKLLSRGAFKSVPIRKSCEPLFEDALYSEILDEVEEKLVDHEYF